MRRLPSIPPAIPGFTAGHILGTGGFADVFLYRQDMPRRQVAVKVLLPGLVSSRVVSMFRTEADLMARLSAHPSILTVYEAGVAADGRPYLVMELCSSELGERFRSSPLPLAEALHIAVKIGSAVETAHRSGVLHRDIKPSNILTTAYGHPVLADFGIASTFGEDAHGHTIGLSVPWSAPEVVHGRTSGTVASEVYSLAATVYSLLAGRSPFERPGGPNRTADLVRRIGRGRPAPLDRPDAPRSLEPILRRALAHEPAERYASVLDLVRGLQAVETELGLAPTEAEVAADGWGTSVGVDPADRTRLVDASSRRSRRSGRAALGIGRSRGGTRERLVIVCAVLTLLLAALTVGLLLRSPASGDRIPVVGTIHARTDAGTVVFSWTDPGLREGDRYTIRTDDGASSTQRLPLFMVDPGAEEQVCITVSVNRGGRMGAASSQKCVAAEAGG